MKRMMLLAALPLVCGGCATVSAAAASVNWWSVAHYATLKMSATLARKAAEKALKEKGGKDEAGSVQEKQ